VNPADKYAAALATADRRRDEALQRAQVAHDAAQDNHRQAVDASLAATAAKIAQADARRTEAHAAHHRESLAAIDALDEALKAETGADPRARLRTRGGGVEVIVDDLSPPLASAYAGAT
jgi:hypothetical protein